MIDLVFITLTVYNLKVMYLQALTFKQVVDMVQLIASGFVTVSLYCSFSLF